MIGIYKIKNLYNNKMYIGQSKNIKRRWKEDSLECPIYQQILRSSGSNNGNSKLNEKIVMRIRIDYTNMSFQEIIKKYSQYSYSLLRSVIYGESWKTLPIYKKKEQKWIEPCIDYSQSLK